MNTHEYYMLDRGQVLSIEQQRFAQYPTIPPCFKIKQRKYIVEKPFSTCAAKLH